MLKRLRRWRALLCTLAVIGILAWLDDRVTSSPTPGYCPETAAWIVAAQDFGVFYSGIQRSDAARAAADDLRQPLSAVELAVRKTTGIRPTPLRWRAWMGRSLLAARADSGFGFCVRPGLLLRAADCCGRVILRRPVEGGISTFGPVFYAWRDGFLIVSESRDYVAQCLTAPEPALEPSEGRDDLRIHLGRPYRMVIHLYARDGLPVSGWINQTITRRTTPLTLPDAWSEPPILTVASSKWNDLIAAFRMLAVVAAPGVTASVPAETETQLISWLKALTRAAAAQWHLDSLPEDWDAQVDECAVALTDIDTDETTPVPEAALVLRPARPVYGPHPLERLVPADGVLPYEWDRHPGVIVPWMGEKLSACFASDERNWFVTSQGPAMARLVGSLREANPLQADVAVRLCWNKLAVRAEILLRKAAELELIPRMNAKDAQDRLVPYIKAMARLGALRLDGRSAGDRVTFAGFLARQGPAPEPVP
jgi:hypothetical protein